MGTPPLFIIIWSTPYQTANLLEDDSMNIDLAVVARDLRLPPEKIERSVQLLDEGNTIPFITRFRKDLTGGLNEEQLLAIKQRVASLRSLAERKAFILKSIESQSKLTDELSKEIEKASTARRLEDLYHPFKAKKQSRAQTARHQGLEPLAEDILAGSTPDVDMSTRATDYVRVDKGLTSVDEVIKGVGDLLAEKFSEDTELRSKLRTILWETGALVSQSAAPTQTPAPANPKPKAKPKPKNAAGKPAAEKPAAEKPKSDEQSEPETTGTAPSTADATASAETATAEVSPTDAQVQDVAKAADATPPTSEKSETSTTSETSAPSSETTETQTQPTSTSAEATGETPAADDSATPAEVDKTTHKMSAGEKEASDDADSNPAADKETLKPTEPEKQPPTVVADPAAESQVVADAGADSDTGTVAEAASKGGEAAAETSGIQPSSQEPTTEVAAPADVKPNPEKAAADATPAKPAAKKKRKKKKKKKTDTAFKDYYDFKQKLKSLPHHQVLAINRGERSNRLKVKIAYDEQKVTDTAMEHLVPEDHPFKPFLQKCVQDALTRLVIPSLERDIRRELNENAEKHAVSVFASNLKNLLLTPPLRGRRVMAIDPGFKSGCSLAILDSQGQFIASSHLFVVGNKQRRKESCEKVAALVKEHNVDMIAIGNGVGCRETEQLVSDAISESLADHPVRYVIVNEAGTSIYSTSEVGREELPDHTPAVRSAISIGRRLQNPISELVKISPANIGVGMYQHDVKAKHLAESLDEVVQFCVNRVGVDVNNASPSLLKFVSGMNALTARRVYEYCKENGGIKNRQQLKEVSGLGDATFVQAAGFLRVRDGDNPLDSTSIHPESYEIAEDIIRRADSTPAELFAPRKPKPSNEPAAAAATPTADVAAASESTDSTDSTDAVASTDSAAPETSAVDTPDPTEAAADTAPEKTEALPEGSDSDAADTSKHTKRKEIIDRIAALDLDAIAAEKQVGKMLMTDLVRAIKKPLWDPRDKISKPISRRGILKADDLKPEMQLDAQVVNVVDFGVFVDIGLGESCLVHVSQLSTRYISDPQMVYAVGDVMKVWVAEIDGERRRVKLTAIRPGSKKETGRGRRRSESGGRGKKPSGDRKPSHARPKFQRKKTVYRPPAKPKPVIPITDDMLKGDAPMRSFSDLLQFKKKTPDDSKKNGES